MATRTKAAEASVTPDTPPAPPPERTYMVRLTLQTTMEWGSTLDVQLPRSTITKLLAGDLATLRVPNGAHPLGHARFVTFDAIQAIDIIGGWDDDPAPGETVS